MKKRKNTAKNEKARAKSAREALRFQMTWEAKKLFPNAGNELADRIDRECTLAEEAHLLPCIQQGKEFLDAFRAKFGTSAKMVFAPFLQNSILACCMGLTTEPASLECDPTEMFTQTMAQEPLTVDITVDGAALSAVYKWALESGKTTKKYSEGLEVLIDALSFRFPAASQLQGLLIEQAQTHGVKVDEATTQRLMQEVHTHIDKLPLERMPFFADFLKLGVYMQQLNSALPGKPDIKRSPATEKSALAACCLGTALPSAKAEVWKGEVMEAEIDHFSGSHDYEIAMQLFKTHFHGNLTAIPNGWMADLGIIKLKLILTDSFRAIVKDGAAHCYAKLDERAKTRLNAELDWYEHYGITADMLLLKNFVQEVNAKFNADISPGTALLEHSVAAFCLGLTPEFPDLDDENDLQFFLQKKHSVREVNLQFNSDCYDDIVNFAKEYFGNGKKEEEISTFSLGKLTLKVYKHTPELPEGVKWYRLGTMQKMFEHYAKYEY